MASGKLTLFIGFLIFFLLINIFMLAKGFATGEVTSSQDAWGYINPMTSLTNYNDWLKTSYDQKIEHQNNIEDAEINGDDYNMSALALGQYLNEEKMAMRNANFGILMSLIAILIFIGFISTIIYMLIPINNYSIGLLSIVIAILLTHFFLDGFYGVLYVIDGVI